MYCSGCVELTDELFPRLAELPAIFQAALIGDGRPLGIQAEGIGPCPDCGRIVYKPRFGETVGLDNVGDWPEEVVRPTVSEFGYDQLVFYWAGCFYWAPASAREYCESDITWGLLVTLEPALADLLRDISELEDPGGIEFLPRLSLWPERFKPRLTRLVGWRARNQDPRIACRKAYDLAHDVLLKSLPP